MGLHETVLPGALLLTAAAVVGVVLLIRSRHPVFAAMLAVVVVVAATPGSIVAWDRSPLLHPTTMHVEGLNVADDDGLTVELVHQLIADEGTEYHFVARGGAEHVAALFDDQHSTGVVTTADPALVSDSGRSIWHLAVDNVRFELVATPASDSYELVTQAVAFVPEDGSASVRIPFPRSAFGATEVKEGQIYTDGWTQEQWADFYEGIAEVTVDGNTITVPTDAGGTATIALSEGISKVTIDH
jgi:hypothetical protein